MLPSPEDLAGVGETVEHVFNKAFIPQFPLKLSTKPFCCGLPGAI